MVNSKKKKVTKKKKVLKYGKLYRVSHIPTPQQTIITVIIYI